MEYVGGKELKTVFIDVETSPVFGCSWQTWQTDLLWIEQDTHIIAFSAKWKDGEHITKALPDYKGYKSGWRNLDDKKLITELWHILDKADLVVGQNSDKFDIKKINSRFIVHRMTPPSPYRTADTKKIVKKVAANDSNKLNELGRIYKLGRKLEHEGIDLWKKCLEGDMTAWAHMKKYNRQDVTLLEQVYNRLLPWANLNLGIFTGANTCPNCGGNNLTTRGWQFNKTTKYRRIVCGDCGKWSRNTHNESDVKPLIGI